MKTIAFSTVAAAVIATDVALAQSTTVPAAPIWDVIRPYLVEVVAVVAAAIVGWVSNVARRKFNIDIEAGHRDALQTAITNAAGLVIAKIGDRARALTIDVKSPAVAEAVNYVIAAVPGALAYFNLTPDQVAEKIRAKIGVMA